MFTKFYKLDFDPKANSDAGREAKIHAIQKNFECWFSQNNQRLSIFDFRETFERYTGLTLELENENQEITAAEKEIYRITNHDNKKLGEICLHRRNRKRLVFHQNLARLDFFDIFTEMFEQTPEKRQLFQEAAKLFSQLQDLEASRRLADLSKKSLQTQELANVIHLENDLWNADKQKPSPASRTSTNLQVLTATTNLPNKD